MVSELIKKLTLHEITYSLRFSHISLQVLLAYISKNKPKIKILVHRLPTVKIRIIRVNRDRKQC